MSYTIDRVINADFEEVDERVRQALTEIDVKTTMKKGSAL